jgi:hypothetical protein
VAKTLVAASRLASLLTAVRISALGGRNEGPGPLRQCSGMSLDSLARPIRTAWVLRPAAPTA